MNNSRARAQGNEMCPRSRTRSEEDARMGNGTQGRDGARCWWRRNRSFRKRKKGNGLLSWIKDLNMNRTTGKLLAEGVRKLHYHSRMKEHFLKDMRTKKKKDKFENFCAMKDRPTLGEALRTTGGVVKG